MKQMSFPSPPSRRDNNIQDKPVRNNKYFITQESACVCLCVLNTYRRERTFEKVFHINSLLLEIICAKIIASYKYI